MLTYSHFFSKPIRGLNRKIAGISSATITKLGKNENVNTEVLEKICRALECDISNIMEIIPDNK